MKQFDENHCRCETRFVRYCHWGFNGGGSEFVAWAHSEQPEKLDEDEFKALDSGTLETK